MPELQAELDSGIADFHAGLHALESCLDRLVGAEEALQLELKRIPRFERLLEPRFVIASLRSRIERLLPAAA